MSIEANLFCADMFVDDAARLLVAQLKVELEGQLASRPGVPAPASARVEFFDNQGKPVRVCSVRVSSAHDMIPF